MPARNPPTCPAAALAKAEVTVPSLDDWEREWARGKSVKRKAETLKLKSDRQKGEAPDHRQQTTVPKLLPVNFRSPLAAIAQSN
jgi:hypothetical protein